MTVERLMDILKESKYTVVLSGNGMVLESDYMLIRDSQESYDIEKKYRYSAEELFSSSLFSTDVYKRQLVHVAVQRWLKV